MTTERMELLRRESPSAGASTGGHPRTGRGGAVITLVAADRIASAAQASSVATRLAEEFAVRASQRDRDGVLPHAEIARLSASGLLAITIPAEFGGADLPPSVVADVVRTPAVADVI